MSPETLVPVFFSNQLMNNKKAISKQHFMKDIGNDSHVLCLKEIIQQIRLYLSLADASLPQMSLMWATITLIDLFNHVFF